MRIFSMLLSMWLTAWLRTAMMTVMPNEEDHPKGHPARHDYDPKSPEAKEWARRNIHPKGERDYPIDHVKAVDTKGNLNHVRIDAGVDINNPEREAFTGRSPEQAKAVRDMNARLAKAALDTIPPAPVVAPPPPPPGNIEESEGQPDTPTPARGKKHNHTKRR